MNVSLFSFLGVRSYKRQSLEQEEKLSNILNQEYINATSTAAVTNATATTTTGKVGISTETKDQCVFNNCILYF